MTTSRIPRHRWLWEILICLTLLSGCAQTSVFNSAAPLSSDVAIPYAVGADSSTATGIIGLSGRDGSTAWHATTGEPSLQFAPVVVGGVVYAEGGTLQPENGTVVAIRLSDGHILWQAQMPSRDFYLAADERVVLVAAGSNGLYALNVGDGSVLWHRDGTATEPVLVGSDIAVAARTDAQWQSAHLEVAGESDGAPLWKLTYVPTFAINTTAAYTSFAGDIEALSLQTGQQLWHSELQGNIATLSNQTVVVASRQQVTELDAATGCMLWQQPVALDSITHVTRSSTAIYGTTLGVLRALRFADGTELWHHSFTGYTVTESAEEDGVLFVLLAGGPESSTPARIAALDGATGAVYWERDIGSILFLAKTTQ